jgi:hypothetical protein
MQLRSRIKALVVLAVAVAALAVTPALARLPLPQEITADSKDYHGCGIARFPERPWEGTDSSGLTEKGDHWIIAYKGAHGDCTFVKAQLKLLLRHSAHYFYLAGKGSDHGTFPGHASFTGGTCKWKRGPAPGIDPLYRIDCILMYHHGHNIYRPGHGAPTIEAIVDPAAELPGA